MRNALAPRLGLAAGVGLAAMGTGSIENHGGIPRYAKNFVNPRTRSRLRLRGMVRRQQMLAELPIDDPNLFSTHFSRGHDLESKEVSGICSPTCSQRFFDLVAFDEAAEQDNFCAPTEQDLEGTSGGSE